MIRKLLLVVYLLSMASGAIAEDFTLKYTSGPDGGVYKIICGDFQGISPKSNIECTPSTGAGQNLQMCIDGEVHACLVNPDQLFVQKEIYKDERIDNLGVITSLYWNRVNMFSQKLTIINFSDFKGKKIGTLGGGATSLEAMLNLTGVIPAEVINYDSFQQLAVKTMVSDYETGKLDAIVAIGGGQIPWALKLNSSSHPVGFDMWDKVKHLSLDNGYFYRMKPLSYPNMEGSVMTLAVRLILVSSRIYAPDDPETKAIQQFYADLTTKLSDIKRKAGKDKQYRTEWLEVSPLNEPSWNKWFPHLKKK